MAAPRTSPLLTLIAGLMALVLGSVTWTQYQQWTRVQQSLTEGRLISSWGLYQFEVEHLRLRLQLRETLSQKDRAQNMQKLALRYHLLASRYLVIKEGTTATLLRISQEYAPLAEPTAAMFARFDPYLGDENVVPAFDEQQLIALRDALDSSSASLQKLVLASVGQQNRYLTSHLQIIQDSMVFGAISALVLALLSVLFAVLALRQVHVAHRRGEELDAARKEAEAASRYKSQFLATMSHEIRTPMNAILGMLKLLRSTELDTRQRDYASKSESAAKSLLRVIDDILDFSKVEAGKLALDVQPFRLNQMMRDLSVILSAYVGTKPIEVLYDIAPDVPQHLMGDSLRLQQVLINLGGNAIKFTARGQVIIRVRRADLPAAPDTAALTLSICDTGIGIAAHNQARIFTGFSQAEASTTRQFGGTGLGLAISRRLLELMGSTLSLHSEEGVGSEFSFTLRLPLAPIPTDGDVPAVVSHPPRQVLVVDDNPHSRDLLAQITASWGWPTVAVASGEEALQALQARAETQQAPFEVIVLDWHMPGIDGWEAARRIRALPLAPVQTAPVIVMITGHSRETLQQRTLEEQNLLNGFLVKPFTPSTLQEATLQADSGVGRLRQGPREGASQRRLAGMRVLVVEDNLLNQQVAEELLTLEGALVTMAANGRLGMEAVQSAQPPLDAVLMDVQMPVMDGYEATRQLRANPAFAMLPIIAMTANALASDRDACLQAGMNEHIGKPFDLNQLVSVLLAQTGRPALAAATSQRLSTTHAPADAFAPTLDVTAALDRMAGLQSLYRHALQDFAHALPQTLQALHQELAAQQRDAALARLHMLKGNAATVGAMDLSAVARAAERQLKQAQDIDATTVLQPLEAAARNALPAIDQALQTLQASTPHSATHAATSPEAMGAARDALRSLLPALQASDLTVLQQFATLRDTLAVLPTAALHVLEEDLQNLDLDSARQRCLRMLEDTAL